MRAPGTASSPRSEPQVERAFYSNGVIDDGLYVSPAPSWVHCDGRRDVVELMRWILTDTGWWAWVRWVEPLIVDDVSQGGMHVQVCVPAALVRPSPKVTAREYARVRRDDVRNQGEGNP